MSKCGECKHATESTDHPDFVRCWLKLPAWVEVKDDNLSGNYLVLKTGTCSFYEHPNYIKPSMYGPT